MPCKISAIIPTKNRPEDLLKAVLSICQQSRLPDELVIIDQSDNDANKKTVIDFVNKYRKINLIYIYDPKILGLVDAKRVSILHATGEIICFLEDDIILEPNYFYEIDNGFARNPEMIGCCGLITNPPKKNFFYLSLYKIFHWGIFQDPRISLMDKISKDLISSDKLSGGASAWRREVFEFISFDVKNGFHMYEDIDFSTRAAKYFGPRLFINTKARLAHYYSPLNREFFGIRQRRKVLESFLYYKKRKDLPWANASFLCLLCGMFFESLVESFMTTSLKSIYGFFLGCYDGITKKLIK